MKQYLLSVYHPEYGTAPSGAEMDQIGRDVNALNDEIRDAGVWVFAGGLHPSSTATVLRVKDGEVLTTDGPFAEGKEHIGGFWVIKTADLDSALGWAAKATRACCAPIEVRPFQDEAED
ncbi:MAG: YciI family protein [Candidatus Dormibacterales bacterium]